MGREAFAARGYAGSRLADIAAEAGLTTGAFYRHFASKWEFFVALHERYGADLAEALGKSRSLRAQVVAWLEAARRHRGVVRAAQELSRTGSPHVETARELRDDCASVVAKRLCPGGKSAPAARGAALMIVDIVSQYAWMEAAGWIPERDPRAVAEQLERLVKRGLYR